MDMSSLQSGLPRPVTDPANVAFKEAALKLTTLYKASQQSRQEGFLDAIDEIWARFLDNGDGVVDVEKMKLWIGERRRRTGKSSIDEDAEMAAALQQSDALDAFETEAVVPSSPVLEFTSRNRSVTSPVRSRPTRSEASEGREDAARRERHSAKRRVLNGAGIDNNSDMHKRGRFG